MKWMMAMMLFDAHAIVAGAGSQNETMMVWSDIHVMAPSLLTEQGDAFDNYVARDMRMIEASAEVLDELVATALNQRPRVVLIAGDLTKDGERASHDYVASQLARLREQGIAVCVIPGNHDISNPNARTYDGATTHHAPTITRDEFARIYADYGYEAAITRDEHSLSYVAEPIEGIVILALDSNRDEENTLTARGDATDSYHNAGRIKPETLQWAQEQARRAHAQGKRVIAMVHHHVVPHFDGEELLLPNYVVAGAERVREQLMDVGVHEVLTGHLHVSDIAQDYNAVATDSIVEIATGSAITYPFGYRTLSLSPDHNSLHVNTGYINSTPSFPQLREQGRERLRRSVPMLSSMLTGKLGQRFAGRLDVLNEPLEQLLMAFVEGNESHRDYSAIVADVKRRFRSLIEQKLGSSVLAEFLLEEVYPQVEPLLRSIVEDRNHCGTSREVVVDDHGVTLPLR